MNVLLPNVEQPVALQAATPTLAANTPLAGTFRIDLLNVNDVAVVLLTGIINDCSVVDTK